MANDQDIMRKLIPREGIGNTDQDHREDLTQDQSRDDFLIELITEQNEQQ